MVSQTGTNMGIYIWENIHEQHKKYKKHKSILLIFYKKHVNDAVNLKDGKNCHVHKAKKFETKTATFCSSI
jgi:hypothetical protein